MASRVYDSNSRAYAAGYQSALQDVARAWGKSDKEAAEWIRSNTDNGWVREKMSRVVQALVMRRQGI